MVLGFSWLAEKVMKRIMSMVSNKFFVNVEIVEMVDNITLLPRNNHQPQLRFCRFVV
jgi:hypothetical protein